MISPPTPSSDTSRRKRCLVAAAALVAVPLVAYSFLDSKVLPDVSDVSMLPLPYRQVTAQQAKQMADRILQSNPSAVRPEYVGDRGRSRVHNIFWLHIQKCGTSLFNTLWLHFCPDVLSKNPQLADRTDLIEYDLIKDYPMKEWCGPKVMFYNHPRVGFHWPWKDEHWSIKRADGGKPEIQEFHSFAMFRDPNERIKSAFSFREMTKLKVPHYSHLGDPNISLEEYVNEPHIPNCQIKMVLGHRCHQYVEPSDLDVEKALEIISSPSFYFGLTDRWDESICLFHSWYGGSTQPFELMNNRPTKRLSISGKEEDIVMNDVDTAFVAGATKIFDERLKRAGCLATDVAS